MNFKQYIISLMGLLVVSCNDLDQFSYEAPDLEEIASIGIAIEASSQSQCNAEVFLSSSTEAVVFYVLNSAEDEKPDSNFIFSQGDSAILISNESTILTFTNLIPGETYTFYAISLNSDGTRSEEVFQSSYTQPDYTINVDSEYTGFASALGSNVEFQANLLATNMSMQYDIDTAWGNALVATLTGDDTLVDQFLYPGTLTFNDDFSISVTGIDIWATGGSGSYNPCTNEINYTLSQDLFTNGFEVEVSLVPQNF